MTEEPTFHEVTATCRTDGCENANYPLTLMVPDDPPDPYVVCGVCQQPITDITTPPEVNPQ